MRSYTSREVLAILQTHGYQYIYSALFEPGEIRGYCVTFPDLPGCITEGNTLEE